MSLLGLSRFLATSPVPLELESLSWAEVFPRFSCGKVHLIRLLMRKCLEEFQDLRVTIVRRLIVNAVDLEIFSPTV